MSSNKPSGSYSFKFRKEKATLADKRLGGTTLYFDATDCKGLEMHVHLRKKQKWDSEINFDYNVRQHKKKKKKNQTTALKFL